MKTPLFASLLLLAGIASSAQAASALVDVQFTGYHDNVQTGAAVVGSHGDAWNALTYGSNNGNVNALSFADGLASSVGITYSAQNFWTASSDYDKFTGQTGANLMSTYLVGYDADISIDLTGLTAGQQYGFWVYTQGDDNAAGRSIGFTANGTAVATATQTNIGTFVEGNNYVYFTTVADANGKIDLDARNLAGEANINGFQMTAVPEPSSLVFMAAGLLAIGALSLRRRAPQR